MIKATALKLVTAENRDLVADVLTKRSQNIKSSILRMLIWFLMQWKIWHVRCCIWMQKSEVFSIT